MKLKGGVFDKTRIIRKFMGVFKIALATTEANASAVLVSFMDCDSAFCFGTSVSIPIHF